MKKNTSTVIIAALAVLTVVFAVLFFSGNGKIGALNKDKEDLSAQVETLTADAAKAAEEASAKLDEATKQNEELTAQLETEKADAAKAAEEAAAKLDEATKSNEDLSAQVETLKADAAKAAEEAAAKLDEATKSNEDLTAQMETLKADAAKAAEDAAAKLGEATKANEDLTAQMETLKADLAKAAEDAAAKLSEATKANEDLAAQLGIVKSNTEESVEEKPAEEKPAEEETAKPVEAEIAEKTEEVKEEVKAATLRPFTLNGKVTLNKQTVGMFANMLAQGNEAKLAKINSLIEFVNGLEYKAVSDGVDGEAFVSLKGEPLVSVAAVHDSEKATAYYDVFPNYSFTLNKSDLGSAAASIQLPENLDKEKLMEAVAAPLTKLVSGIKFGAPEQVEETILGTVFTSRTPIDMSVKELSLMGLNALKEILENKEVASVLEQFKAKGLDISSAKVDEWIASVNNLKDEELPAMDAAMFANEKQDMIFRVVLIKDEKEMLHSLGGTIDGNGVSEYQMGDQVYTSVKAGKEGIFMIIRAQGMEIGINVVPEARENGKAATATVTLSGMELLKAEVELLNEGTLTGTVDTEVLTDINIMDLQDKAKAEEMGKALYADAMTNYKPALIEKLGKIAPDMLPVFSSIKRLVKGYLPAIMEKIPMGK